MVNARTTDLYDRFVTHKVDANSLPPHDFADILRNQVIAHGPKGLPQVHLGGGTATEANELAIQVALLHHARDHNSNHSDLCVLAFDNAHHGNSDLTSPQHRAAFP